MFKKIRVFAQKLIGKLPKVGDPVWWAPKEVGMTVTEVRADGVVIFQGGNIVQNKNGREVPRWTTATAANNLIWNNDIKMYIVGQGRLPTNVRGQVILPEPVLVSGKSKGSFAVGA